MQESTRQPELPSSVIHSFLTAAQPTGDQNPHLAVAEALEYWSSGLLAHEHPSEPAKLLDALVDLLNSHTTVQWGQLQEHLTSFLTLKILDHAAETLSVFPNFSAPSITEKSLRGLSAADVLLSATPGVRPPSAVGDSVFLILRLSHSDTSNDSREVINRFTATLCQNRSLDHLINTNFLKLVPRISRALSHETDSPDPETRLQIHSLASSTTVLYSLLTALDAKHLQRYKQSIYPLVHPLIEHVHQPTRSAGLGCLTFLNSKLGPFRDSTKFLRGSLLWCDAETAIQAIPLLCGHLSSGIDDEEAEKCRKRVLATLGSLMTARDGRNACIRSVTAAATLTKEPLSFGNALLNDADRWIRSLAEFLSRISRLVGDGKVDGAYVIDVCEALKEGIRWCWLRADGFRSVVLDACLVAVNEVSTEEVSIAARGVLRILACCNPERMRRLLGDLRATCSEYPSLSDTVEFLDSVQPLTEVECKKVELGGMVARFFPELNQF